MALCTSKIQKNIFNDGLSTKNPFCSIKTSLLLPGVSPDLTTISITTSFEFKEASINGLGNIFKKILHFCTQHPYRRCRLLAHFSFFKAKNGFLEQTSLVTF
jgi:hypothetical protein